MKSVQGGREMKSFGIGALLAAGMLLISSTAHAAVVYNWVSTSGTVHGSLTLSDDAYANGGLSFDVDSTAGPEFIEFNRGTADDLADLLDIHISGSFGPYFNLTVDDLYRLDFNVSILDGGFLSGGMHGGNQGASFNLSGDGTSWDGEFRNDNGSCHNEPWCSTTGYWQLISGPTPAPVPEPFTAGLLLAGMAALTVLRRRSSH
jgi:MYXO-CTERM domain-containing protein